MSRLSITHLIAVGLLAWGIPASFVVGQPALEVLLMVLIPFTFALKREPINLSAFRPDVSSALILFVFALAYVALDSILGRQKLSINLFLASDATRLVVDDFNTRVSQGRGPAELIGALMIFLPFALADAARRASLGVRPTLWAASIMLLFYEVGISRGFLLMAILAVLLPWKTSLVRICAGVALAFGAFTLASIHRGDFEEIAFSHPIFDALLFPLINLSLMLSGDCAIGHWSDFVGEFLKKFAPAFLFQKEIYSFNIEMTRCIYPSTGDTVESVSIFTYLGEIFFYQPSLVTALIAGSLMSALALTVDRLLVRAGLFSTRLFAGLMCVVLLRSRVLDVLSFLLFLIVFVIVWRAFWKCLSKTSAPVSGAKPEPAPSP